MHDHGVIDERLIGALHVRGLSRSGFDQELAAQHVSYQIGTLASLLEGRFEGDASIAELLEHGDLGIGTVAQLAGELIVIEGSAYVVDGEGKVHLVPPHTTTPFAVVSRFLPGAPQGIEGPIDLDALLSVLHELTDQSGPVCALRIDGKFTHLRLRSVSPRTPPFASLVEATRAQSVFDLPATTGSLVGFRFPELAAGLEVPGFHLHFISDDRRHGGHVLNLELARGIISIDGGDQLHVELPEGVDLGVPGSVDSSEIEEAEGRASS